MIFIDIETNSVFRNYAELEELKIFCIVCVEESGKVHTFYPPRLNDFLYYYEQNKSETFVAHNMLGFDALVLEHVMGVRIEYTLDTLLLSQLLFPDLINYDAQANARLLPKKYWGLHSLEAWGKRIGFPKTEFKDFTGYTPEMLEYCLNDTLLLKVLHNHLTNHSRNSISFESIKLEHEFKKYTMLQTLEGVPYDVSRSQDIIKTLNEDFNEITKWAQDTLPYKEIAYKRQNKPPKIIYFNPTSRDQVGEFFKKKYDWNPSYVTPKAGKPKISEEILESLPFEEAKTFMKAFQINKLKGFLSTGDSSWSKHYCNYTGRIHGVINTLGTATGRCAHHSPNLGQVPSVRSYMGSEIRALFHAGEYGYTLVGCDASSLELRCLAHYLYAYDGGEYASLVLDGDVHTYNQKAAGLATRDQAKTFIYAMIYGAGNIKLGSIINPSAPSYKQETLGRSARNSFLDKINGYKILNQTIQDRLSTKGYLRAIDGRNIYVEKTHTALNYLLQSCGAIIMKQATVLFYERAKHLIKPCLHVHDEFQVICKNEDAHQVGELAVKSIQDTQSILGFKLRLDGEYKVGYSWDKTH